MKTPKAVQKVSVDGVLASLGQDHEGKYMARFVLEGKKRGWASLGIDHEQAAAISRLMFRRCTIHIIGEPDGDVLIPPCDDEDMPF